MLLDSWQWMRALRSAMAIGLAVWIFAALASAQLSSAISQDRQRTIQPGVPVIAGPSSETTPSLPTAHSPKQMPPRAPTVWWDGKQLSINCENSTLSDILATVRARTGAEIEIPAAAASVRIATNLGPAPAREVLASLLDSGDFDYIIQGSDSNKDGLGSVTLTLRGKADGEIASVAVRSAPAVSRMPGHSDSGPRELEDAAEAPSRNSSPAETASTPDGAEASREPASAGAEPASATVQLPAATDPKIAPPDQVPADGGGSIAGGNNSSVIQPVAAAAPGPSTTQPSPGPQSVQDLQRLYQQRREIQSQQNQTGPAPSN